MKTFLSIKILNSLPCGAVVGGASDTRTLHKYVSWSNISEVFAEHAIAAIYKKNLVYKIRVNG